jgi:alcohol dehydrogenase (cytochrome c)
MAKIGNFEIVGELGRGAMGVVFRGFDPAIGRNVAIKVIRNQAFATNEEIQEARLRFAREAAAAGRLSHPNIVTVYHFGEEPGYQYLAMELVEGEALKSAAPSRCLAILRQVAGALDYAHAQGVIHRDIKPSNILVRADGQAKLTDFGVARISSQTITQSGVTMGTPSYMAPEQVMASRVDGKADQFSLAVVAFETLTGRKPFQAPTDHAVMFAIVSGERPSAHEINPALPPSVSAVLQRGLAKEAGNRFPSCKEFVGALESAFATPAKRGAAVGELAAPLVAPQNAAPVAARVTEAKRLRYPLANRYTIAASIVCTAVLVAGILRLTNARSARTNPLPVSGGSHAVVAPTIASLHTTSENESSESGAREPSPKLPDKGTSSVAASVGVAHAVVEDHGDVTFERIVDSVREPKNWLTYAGNYQGHHYSASQRINKGNIARLKLIWKYELSKLPRFEATPLVADGVMYVSAPSQGEDYRTCGVAALDARTGAPLWTYKCETSLALNGNSCCGWFLAMARITPAYINRGLAMLDDKILVGTADASLLALSSKTGKRIWDTLTPNWEDRAGYSIEAAPLAIKDKVIVGISNRNPGTRSFLASFDVANGKPVWKLFTVPAPGEPGNETWLGDSWRNGVAWTSGTGSYDPELNLLFWGTGSPSLRQDDGNSHLGDNLFSSSLLALDAGTGKLRWHFQFTPHNVHGWNSYQAPVLIDSEVGGHRRRLALIANGNGFYYVLDANTGSFLSGSPYVNQTWARGLDSLGRPIQAPTHPDAIVFPDSGGGTGSNPSFNPQTRFLYMSVREQVAKPAPTASQPFGSVRAIDTETGKFAWIMDARSAGNARGGHVISSGLLSTAGGLVFGGTNEGRIFALDASTGKILWTFETGGSIQAYPISYEVQSQQYLAVSDQRSVLVFGLN